MPPADGSPARPAGHAPGPGGLLAVIGSFLPGSRSRLWFVLASGGLIEFGAWYLARTPVTGSTGGGAAGDVVVLAWLALLLWVCPSLFSSWLGLAPLASGGRRLEARRSVSAGAALALASGATLVALSPFISTASLAPAPLRSLWLSPLPLGGKLLAALAVAASLEVFHRRFLLGGLEPEVGVVAAVWIQALLGSVALLGAPLPLVVLALVWQLLMAALVIYTRSLLPSIALQVWVLVLALLLGGAGAGLVR